MASVYVYCTGGGREPAMLDLALRCRSWGVEAILGRAWLSAKEVQHMTAALNVYYAYKHQEDYRDKDGQKNWAEWARLHPGEAEVLSAAAAEVDHASRLE